jgi:hypothetical protein
VSRERRALAAFLVLAVLATVPAVLFRAGAADRRASATSRRAIGCCTGVVSASGRVEERTAARMMAANARQQERAARIAASRAARDRATTCPSVPLDPLARPVPQHRDVQLLRAVGRVPGVPPVTRMERFSLGHRAWLGTDGVPVVFEFYRQRMRPVGFAAMPASVRREIGVSPTGPVDSPALLYASGTGAALLQGLTGGEVRLTLFCGPVEL